ncbi:MAG TPA: hypothetical protein VGU46_11540 [Acidobacteriaceae bacterium]|nr:hypothetical protein [Acidobacteriaceae bacterium]
MTHHEYIAIMWANPICGALIFLVLFMRRRASSFPIFTAWVATDTVITAVIPYVFYHCQNLTYRYTYRTLNILDAAFQLLVVYEICTHVFRPTGTWAPDVRRHLAAIAAGSTALALAFAALAHPEFPLPIQRLVWRIDLFSSSLICQMLVGMLVLSSIAGLPWKAHASRIAQVFGLSSFVALLVNIVTSGVNSVWLKHIFGPLMRGETTFGVGCELFLIVMLWQDAPAPQDLPQHLRNQIYTLQRQVENDLTRIRSWRNS